MHLRELEKICQAWCNSIHIKTKLNALFQTPTNVNNTAPYRYGRRAEGNDAEFSDDNLPFEDQTIRHAFVRKVYLLLTVQMLFTFGFIVLSTMV